MPDVYKNRNISIVGVARIEKPENFTFWPHAPACRHIDIRNTFHNFKKWFQQLGQMPQKCPCPGTNPLAQTVYLLQGGKVHPNFENKKNSEKNFLSLLYDQKNTLNQLVKSVFTSVDNYGRYLQFCDRRVCSFQYVATQRLQLGAFIGDVVFRAGENLGF